MKSKRTMVSLSAALIPAALITAQLIAKDPAPKPAAGVVLASDVEWGALNPARGKQGPRAANLWGDRTGAGTTGFLVKFADGFSSPPHIHNVTYRGVVISGLVHNDDPDAEEMWMPPGSYWTQPAGEVHITAAKGENAVVYIEIQSGPYLVLPAEQASDNGERPINVDPSNMVWLDGANSTWVDPAAEGAEITFLWGKPQGDGPTATLVRLPAGFEGQIRGDGSPIRAVIIQGEAEHQRPGEPGVNSLGPGNYFGSEAKATHNVTPGAGAECILYVRTEGKFNVRPAALK